ncbi:hypothetical protein [Natrinema longum]|uniref:Uncharacterized protein n=1 Tax=Natrinema longum TaxID=370324 RepID=A0A8A2U9Z6_9EURY|nr:hypothetical protein [Natrinema longum]MBZ6496516.1 hypothetical protein [Natrinema longum]QSW85579.1 hypothetical protein J0X27_01680 [Natrinema longum]
MTPEFSFDEAEFDFPFGLSIHERCSDPCPQFGDRFDGCEEFESSGMWGPKIETADGEMIADGHESVRTVLDAILEDESPDTRSCSMYNCDTEATHTVEVGPPPNWFTTDACPDCVEAERSNVNAVYEGLETNSCEHDRCFTAVHDSRDYCPAHQ